jgi:hypothetical protein
MVNTIDIEIIISRYNESLSWTLMEPFNQFKYTVYNKGDNELFEKTHVTKIINLPNVGRNDHTYLYHIVTNYDKLNLITVFLPGSTDLKYKMYRAKKVLHNVTKPENDKGAIIGHTCRGIFEKFKTFNLNSYACSSEMNRTKNNEHLLKPCIIRPYGNWYGTFFGKEDIFQYTYWGIFAIHKNDITHHPVSRYKILMSILSTHSNPEAGHYIERSWCRIFHPMNFTEFYEEPDPHEQKSNLIKMSLGNLLY